MIKKIIIPVIFFASQFAFGQSAFQADALSQKDHVLNESLPESGVYRQFTATEFLDAAINSVNSFTSLVKKENYRNKITSLNNPTSSDMGFNLENDIQTALKPLLAKAKSTNTEKFSQVISSFFATPAKTVTTASKSALPLINPVFSSILSLVGSLAVSEKKITRDDLDSFISITFRYFLQYQRLNQANAFFDQNIDRLNTKLAELQFDLKEYILDLVTLVYQGDRAALRKMNVEELFLKYLDKSKLELRLFSLLEAPHYPSDGMKSAKDVANSLQKLFNEYQKIYTDNYQQIKSILLDAKKLGKSIDVRQVDTSVRDIEELYNDSKNADALSLRLNTLSERLKVLTVAEQVASR